MNYVRRRTPEVGATVNGEIYKYTFIRCRMKCQSSTNENHTGFFVMLLNFDFEYVFIRVRIEN